MLRQILANIKSTPRFSLIADEASDISHHEHINISIRWVDMEYEIHEDSIGLFQLPDTRRLKNVTIADTRRLKNVTRRLKNVTKCC